MLQILVKIKKISQICDMASKNFDSKNYKSIWSKFKPQSYILFDKLAVYDQTNYKVKKSIHWKIKLTIQKKQNNF